MVSRHFVTSSFRTTPLPSVGTRLTCNLPHELLTSYLFLSTELLKTILADSVVFGWLSLGGKRLRVYLSYGGLLESAVITLTNWHNYLCHLLTRKYLRYGDVR